MENLHRKVESLKCIDSVLNKKGEYPPDSEI